MERILTTKQMRLCEKRSDETGVSLAALMDNAGEALARAVLKECMGKSLKNCVILAGKGNNGGDGFVAANFLAFSGMNVSVLLCCGEPSTELSKNAYSKLDRSVTAMQYTEKALDGCEVIIDCVFGTGFKGELNDQSAKLFGSVNSCDALRIACDVPSGCDASSGKADPNAFKADLTVTFHKKKLGLLISPAKYFCGEVKTADIGIPESCEKDFFPVDACDDELVKQLLPLRIPYGHKGTFGKLTAVCGSEKYIGAAGMSVLGAMRTGVGLCELCTAGKVIDSLSSTILECIYTRLETDSDGFILDSNAETILEKTKRSDCLLIGCGMGHTAQTEELIARIVTQAQCPVVIDADGINSLAANIDVLQKKKTDVILTPHLGELARLCGCDIPQVTADTLGCAKQLAEKYGVTVIAKSSESLVVTKDGCVLVDEGCSALAKGGSGDILAGITASLTAQGCKGKDAGVLACCILGRTAKMLSSDASERSVLPTDILKAIPYSLKAFEEL